MPKESTIDHRPVSVSSLTQLKKSAKNYYYRYLSGKPFDAKTTPPMLFGGAYHCIMLENHNFDEKFIVNDLNRNTNEFKALKADCDEKRIRIIKTKDKELATTMRNELLESCAEVAPFLETDGVCEKTFNNVNEHGFHITGNLDKYIPDMKAIVELKTINKMTEPADLIKKIINDYPITPPHYFQLVPDAQNFYFIFQEKEPPYDACVVFLEPEILEGMQRQYDSLMRYLRYCIENNSWPGISRGELLGVRADDVPPWLRNQIGIEQ